jgi:hypothetical protein
VRNLDEGGKIREPGRLMSADEKEANNIQRMLDIAREIGPKLDRKLLDRFPDTEAERNRKVQRDIIQRALDRINIRLKMLRKFPLHSYDHLGWMPVGKGQIQYQVKRKIKAPAGIPILTGSTFIVDMLES